MTTLTVNTSLASTGAPPAENAPDAPTLSVSGSVVTVTAAADPTGIGTINSRGYQWSVDGGVTWNFVGLVTFPANFDAGVFSTEVQVQTRVAIDAGAQPWSPSGFITTEAESPYVAPTLTSPTASLSGSNNYTSSVITNKPVTLYRYVSTNSTETAATIKANGVVQSVGAGTIPGSGGPLAFETTYYVHWAAEDSLTTVVASSGSFTTAAEGTATGSVSTAVVLTSAPGVEPYAVMMDVFVTGASVTQAAANQWDPARHKLTAITDWGDPHSVSDKVVNLPLQWNDTNISYGFTPSHVYTVPGTYTATTRVFEPDGTLVGVSTRQFQVTSAASIFSGNRTILYDPAGVGDNATYPGSQVRTNWAGCLSAAQALNQTCRILNKRGETLTITTTQQPGSSIDNLYIGVWGPGNSKPTIELPASNSITAGSASSVPGALFNWETQGGYTITFTGQRIIGPWDAATETGGQYRFIRTTKAGTNRRFVLNDCEFSGWAAVINDIPFGNELTGFFTNNCDITNWGDYGQLIFGTGNECISINGTAIHQKRDALMGGGDKDFTINQHGPLRLQAEGRTDIQVCDLFSRNSWFVNGASGNRQPSSQPLLRLFFSTQSNSSTFYPVANISRLAGEGGSEAMIQIKNQNERGAGGAISLVMDKILLAATACTWNPFQIQWSGWSLRNCAVFIPNFPVRNESWRGVFGAYFLNNNLRDNPIAIHNMTVINLKNAASMEGNGGTFDEPINGTKVATDFTSENNAIYQVSGSPNEAIDVDLSTAMPTVGGVWVSRFDGLRWKAGNGYVAKLTMDTALATPAGLVTTIIPNGSSPLIDDATTGLRALDDFYGKVRTNPDRGAAEA
jgi:hypothetical protein